MKQTFLVISLIFLDLCYVSAQNLLEKVKKAASVFASDTTYHSWAEALKNPEKVTVLDLGGQKLQNLSPQIGLLKNLQQLTLSDNELKSLPPEIAQLKRLKWLDVYNNQLSELPIGFAQLDSLEYLDLGWNRLKTIPEAIYTIKNLKHLYLYGNQLKKLPEAITQLQNLEVLRLGRGLVFLGGGNRLKKLPDNFGKLGKLQELYLPDNQLNTLPETFAQLKSLKHLDLNHNRFGQIPAQIEGLDSLRYLSIWNRGFSAKSRGEVTQKMPQTRFDWQEDYEGVLWGLQAGFQQGKYSVAELGILKGFKKDILFFGLGASAELNLNTRLTGVKLSAIAHGLTIFSTGLHTIYYLSPTQNSLALRPEIGIGWGLWSINYGYNIVFAKGMESVNRHLVSARLIVPIAPFFSPFK
ncbi:MAG: leucine-rich repeat domain-containing protein [Microscillaceae bacterium]|jgi:hypothetical protein|nr:leucine-rich repeat domain-containing protein [Microscillaceae bacterium]